MSDEDFFAYCREVSEALVAHYGGLEPAVAAFETEGDADLGALMRKTLGSTSVDEFMDQSPGWDAWKRRAEGPPVL